jgi:hypothetical protein
VQPARVLRRAHSLDRVPCGEDRNLGTPETLNLSLAGFPFREVAVGLVRKVEGRLEMLLDLLDSAQIGVDSRRFDFSEDPQPVRTNTARRTTQPSGRPTMAT